MEDYLSPRQIADKLLVKSQTIWRYIRSKKLRAVKLGKGYRVSTLDLEEFIKKNITV